ncbi:hypothetical protein LO763_22785 [Glycomyces sp. A-F 0318]|uniref:hypothetical protein n=1 Tax=Glycomyces amatae TaxID=2881355 RepID=UPI001E648D88|nr:hypothetical protein [Glycomyces amatae]MCD0446446.1 hypothetical protein [Glycomyces amatae]
MVFLGLTGVVLGMEIGAADQNPATVPWTDSITDHVPGEATAAAIGARTLWLVAHFARRYRRHHATSTDQE